MQESHVVTRGQYPVDLNDRQYCLFCPFDCHQFDGECVNPCDKFTYSPPISGVSLLDGGRKQPRLCYFR